MHTSPGLCVLFFFKFRRCLWAHKNTHPSIHVCILLYVDWSVRFCDRGSWASMLFVAFTLTIYIHDGCLWYIRLAGLPTSWINAQCVHTTNSNWCPLSTQFTYISRHCIAKGSFTRLSTKAKRWKHNCTNTALYKMTQNIHFSLISVLLFYFFPHRRCLWF